MLSDLAADQPGAALAADVAIIGGGTAGLILAHLLARGGKRVLVLESGSEHETGAANLLNEVEQTGDPYGGAVEGRFRGLGGTSQAWGGALLPFAPADFAAPCDRIGKDWPIDPAALLAELPTIERIFSLSSGPYAPPAKEAAALELDHFVLRMPKWPTFGKRNVASLLSTALRTHGGVHVCVNATATDFLLDDYGRLAEVVARAANGNTVKAKATHFVLAAGALETTRLLLLLDRQHDDRIFRPGGTLGHYLHDHLSAPIGTVMPNDRAELNRTFAFRFERSGMRSIRYELASEARAGGLVAAFVHIAFEDDGRSGFSAIRAVLQALQGRRRPPMTALLLLARQSPWVLRAIFWRYARQRVLAPDRAPFLAHLVTEQQPIHSNRIGLSDQRRDMFGLPQAALHWRVTDEDVRQFRLIAALFTERWEDVLGRHMGSFEPRSLADIRATLAGGGGIYHPGGTTRMAARPTDGVVGGDLRCFGIPNLFVASTSVFPAGGGANPTLTLLLFVARLARLLTGKDASGGSAQ